jgi:hypothetical protein
MGNKTGIMQHVKNATNFLVVKINKMNFLRCFPMYMQIQVLIQLMLHTM